MVRPDDTFRKKVPEYWRIPEKMQGNIQERVTWGKIPRESLFLYLNATEVLYISNSSNVVYSLGKTLTPIARTPGNHGQSRRQVLQSGFRIHMSSAKLFCIQRNTELILCVTNCNYSRERSSTKVLERIDEKTRLLESFEWNRDVLKKKA